jgi:hypothetical protein
MGKIPLDTRSWSRCLFPGNITLLRDSFLYKFQVDIKDVNWRIKEPVIEKIRKNCKYNI